MFRCQSLTHEPLRGCLLTESPDLFDQPVVQFAAPFAGQESDDSLTAHQKFSPVSPIAPLRGDLTLHHHLGLKTLEVAKDRGDSHHPSAALEAE
jgi:hypothetical protein